MEYDLKALHKQSKALRERSSQNLQNFLKIEMEFGFGFAGLAKQYLEVGDFGDAETSRQNAVAALDAIDHFKDRLPPKIRREIETKRLELAALIPWCVGKFQEPDTTEGYQNDSAPGSLAMIVAPTSCRDVTDSE
jgi:hypothetical protein